MPDTGTGGGRLAAITTAVRALGFIEHRPGTDFSTAALAAKTARAVVTVRLIRHHTDPDVYTVQLRGICPRRCGSAWRAHLDAAVPSQVIVAAASAALSAPMPCQNGGIGSCLATPAP